MPNLPPSWKREIQETIGERADTDREQRQAEQGNAASQIATAIDSLADAQQTQTRHEDRNENINIALAVVTIFLVFLTVIFTGLSWLAFRQQLTEMKKVYGPINEQAKAAEQSAKANIEAAEAATEQSKNSDKSLIEAQRAWVGPSNAQSDADPIAGKPYDIVIQYGLNPVRLTPA